MATKTNKVTTKKYDLTNEEAALINAMRTVTKAREAHKALNEAAAQFETLADNFRYDYIDDDDVPF